MPVPKGRTNYRAISPESIRAEDLSMKIIVLAQIKMIHWIASTVFNSPREARFGLLNLKNSLFILDETLDKSAHIQKTKQENKKEENFAEISDTKMDLVFGNIKSQNEFFTYCMKWYASLVPKFKVYKLLPMKEVGFSFDRGFIDRDTGEQLPE